MVYEFDQGTYGGPRPPTLPEYSRGIEYCDCRVPAGSGGPSPPDIGAFTRASPHIVHRGLKFNR